MVKRTHYKKVKRFISVMLSVLLVVNTLGLSAFAAEASDEEPLEAPVEQGEGAMNGALNAADDDPAELSAWAALQEEIDAAAEGAVITVENNVTAGPADSALTIPGDKKITLILEGCVLDRALNEETAYGSVIINHGDLTITGGTITGGNTTGEGGGIWNSGTLKLDDVLISDNHAGDFGGGVYSKFGDVELTGGAIISNSAHSGGGVCVEGGTMNMQGGSIRTNEAQNGAGIHVGEAEFCLGGGEIRDNKAGLNGGGVFLQYRSVEMTGGSISGNVADSGSAVYIDMGTFTLAGGTMSGNTSGDGAVFLHSSGAELCIGRSEEKINVTGNTSVIGDECNVYLRDGQLITVESIPVEGSVIGITTDKEPTNGNPVPFAALVSGVGGFDASASFRSDAGYDVDFSSSSLMLKYNRISTWAELQEALTNGGEAEWDPSIGEEGDWYRIIRLTDDLTAGSGDPALLYYSAAYEDEVVLDLCGHTIDRGLGSPQPDGHVLKINGGALIIRDSKGGGTITGGNTTGNGGGIYIDDGTLTLEGGEITGNRARDYGGGISVESGGTLRQTGGSVTGNTAMIGGVHVMAGSSYEVSGTPVVTGNEDDDHASSNVFLAGSSVISVTGGLTDGARLGISADSDKTVTSGYAQYYDESIPVGQYFDNDSSYHLYFDPDREVAIEIGHDKRLAWTWTEEENSVQVTAAMRCVNCGEVDWSETTDSISGPGAYSDEEGGFSFTAAVTHDGEEYSDTKYVAPKRMDAVEPYIDEDGEYHSGTEEHYLLKYAGNTFCYKVNGNRPGDETDQASLMKDLFLIDGEMIRLYCGELSDEETVITLPKTCNGVLLQYIGDGSHPFYDPAYTGAVTIHATENRVTIAPGAFSGRENVKIIGPHACHLTYGGHDDETGHYTVEYSDEHIFEAIDELTEWTEDYGSAVIHLQCIRESCCFCDVAITDTTVTGELIDDKIEYTATGEYNGSTYTVRTTAAPYCVKLDPDNGVDDADDVICSKVYKLPGSDDITYTAPAGTVFNGWKDESGTEYDPGALVALTSPETRFIAVWRSDWALVNSALYEGGTVTLRNDITAGADDTALSVPAGVTASLDFNGFKADRGLTAPAENGYAVRVDGVLNMSSSAGGGLITGGGNSGDGGGIFVAGTGSVDIENVDIKNNLSVNGAGIYLAAGGAAVVTGCRIMYNEASAKGGGAFVSEAAKLSVGRNTQIIDNVANEGAGIYIKSGGSTHFEGPDIKVKNNYDAGGSHDNIHPEKLIDDIAPVTIGSSLQGSLLCFSIAGMEELGDYLAALFLTYAALEISKYIIIDITNKNDTPDQEDPNCDHPHRNDKWSWNADYTKANANLICSKCGNVAESEDSSPDKSVGEDGVTTYTAHVQYGDQTFTSVRTVDPYIVTLRPGERCHAAPVIRRVPHDKNMSGSCKLDVPAQFVPEGAYTATSWIDEESDREYIIGSVIEVDKDKTFTLLWAGAVPVTYKKGADDPHENDFKVFAEYNKDYEFLPCMFERENYDFTKWKVIQAGVVDQNMYKKPGEKLKATTDIEATAQWQSKWTTLGEKMKDPQENNIVIDLIENVTAQEGDTELLVPEGKTVTLNMKGYTLDRSLDAAAEDGCVIRVKGTLILHGPGTLTGGFSTDSASGIIPEDEGTLKISGALNITGNGTSVDGDADSRNVYVPENAKIEVTGALNDAKIGITTAIKPAAGSPVVFTEDLNGNGSGSNFVSDDSRFAVGLNEEGEAFLETQAAAIKGVTGTFNEKIKLNYYFDIPKSVLEDEASYVTLTNDRTGRSVKLLIKDAQEAEGKGRKFSIDLAAKEASDTIIARIFNGQGDKVAITGELRGGDYTETGVPYSLMQYFAWLEESGTEEEKKLGAAAKDYCSAAQIYFDYHADGLEVSSAVDEVTEETLNSYIATRTGELPDGVRIRGITAMLEADNTFRLYYSFRDGEPSGLTFAIDGNEAELRTHSDGARYIALSSGVFSNHLQDTHTYSVSDGTTSYTITASVLTYARSCAMKSSKTESDLGKALYLYNKAAVERFGQ